MPLLAALSTAVACALLSVVVVSRRWAFIGEGISHSGLGGAGTAWILALAFPSLFDNLWVPYVAVVLFCLATAVAIGYVTRSRRIHTDAAIGIFLVASLAWGILAQSIYLNIRHASPVGFDILFFGQLGTLSREYAAAALSISTAVILTLAALHKQILFFCLDPDMAEAAGIPTAPIHYLLMILIALTVVIGMRVTGSILVTALLVLPGVTAMLLTDRLWPMISLSVATAAIGTLAGLLIAFHWSRLPAGPLIVLSLVAEFAAAYAFTAARAPFRPTDP